MSENNVNSTEEIVLSVEMGDAVSAQTAEAYAVGKRGGVDVAETDPTWHNNAKYYAEQAEEAAGEAQGAEEAAQRAEAAQAAAEAARDLAEAIGAGAAQSAAAAAESAQAAATAKTGAETAQSAAAGSATAAEGSAGRASQSATAAAGSATAAGTAKTAAETARDAAAGSATAAAGSASAADQSAQAAAASAQAAEDVAESIPADYSQLSADVTGLKSAFEQLDANVITESAGPAPIVSIADGADGMPMRKVEVSIEPVQDLHGYEYPWPAGGGKNKLPPSTEASTTSNGITAVTNADESYTLSGTATATATVVLRNFLLSAGEYLLSTSGSSITTQSPGSGTCSIYIRDTDNSTTLAQYSLSTMPESISFTISATTNVRLYMFVNSGWTISGNLYPMIRLATEADATFAPYSNICPITGWTGAKVTRTGINIWDEEWEVGGLSRGGNITRSDRIRSKNYIPIVPGTTYYLVVPSTYTGNFWISYYTADKTFINGSNTAGTTVVTKNGTFTTPDNARFMRFQLMDTDTYGSDISINYPATNTEYHAYQGQTYEVTFSDTFYGGTLDVVSGKLVVDRASIILNGSDGESYTNVSSANGARIAVPISSDSIVWTDQTAITGKLWCNTFKEMTNSSTFGGAVGIHYRANGGHSIIIGFGKLIPSDNIYAGAKAWFAQNPTKIVYALAETKEYTLTPTEIKTLLGVNNIWADAGNTVIAYPADTKMYIDRKITEAVANALNA